MNDRTAVIDQAGSCERCGAGISRAHETASCPSCGEPLSIEVNRRLSNDDSRRVLAARGILPYDDEPEPAPAPAAGPDNRTAGFMIRAAAHGIDTIVGVAIGLPATVAAFVVLAILGRPGGPEEWARQMEGLTFSALAWSLCGSTLYAAMSEWIGGATLGKLACGLRVVSDDFSTVTFRGAFVRAVAFFVDGMLFGLVALHAMQQSRMQQRYGDRWGRTLVVRVQAVPESDRGPLRMIIGALVGCAVWGAFLTCASVSHVLSR